MGYKRKPIYEFDDKDSVGVKTIPDGSMVVVKNYGGVPTNFVKVDPGGNIADGATIENSISYLREVSEHKLDSTLKGASNGLAELDANGLIPSVQLPSFVDDILLSDTKAGLVSDYTFEAGKIYVAKDTNITFRWNGSGQEEADLIEVSQSIALGETSSTAYRGDNGKTAYDHSQVAHAPSNANNYSHPTGAGSKHIPSGGSAGEFLKYDSSGTAVWATPSYTTNTDTNTWRGIHDSPSDGATTTSISSNWAYDNVKTAVPAGAKFTDTDTNTWRGISDAIDSTSSTVSASSAAVKAAYDKGNHTHPYAASSHGNHVPATQTANNAVYLRNDNTWQTISASDVGALARGGTAATVNVHTDSDTGSGEYDLVWNSGVNVYSSSHFHINRDAQLLTVANLQAGSIRVGNNVVIDSNGRLGEGIVPGTASELSSAIDLNDLQSPGFFFQSENADTSTEHHYPENAAGSLMIQPSASGVTQLYSVCHYTGSVYSRSNYENEWGPWRSLVNKNSCIAWVLFDEPDGNGQIEIYEISGDISIEINDNGGYYKVVVPNHGGTPAAFVSGRSLDVTIEYDTESGGGSSEHRWYLVTADNGDPNSYGKTYVQIIEGT